MKRFLLSLVFLLPIIAFSQIQENVVIENQIITGASDIKASNSIIIRPSTVIQSGSIFTAQIIFDAYIPISLSNENYVLTRTFQVATQNTIVANNSDVIENVTYFDGLGRPIQNVAIKQSPSKKDIVTHIAYDTLGRQTKEFLPYTDNISTNGSLKANAGIATQQYYQVHYPDDFPGITDLGQINAYSEKDIEFSPVSRTLKQAAPGIDWKLGNNHEIEFEYETNTSSDNVKLFTVILNNSVDSKVNIPTLSPTIGTYGDGELFKIVTKDENHARGLSKLHTTEEFKNKSGQVILKRTYALVSGVEEAHDTYYVYDDLGNLTFVFPPKVNVNDGISAIELSELSYQYTFDYRNRMVKKQIPGKAEEYIIYDALDRPVLTQDANLRANNQWLFTKFDVSGRPIYTGKYSHGSELNLYGMQNHFDTQNNNADTYYEEKLADQGALGNYYSNNNFPSTNVDIFTVNYYDNYIFDRAGAPISTNAYNTNSTTRLKGLATGSKVKVLTTNNWITTVTYYDEKARPFYVYSNNSYLQTTDIVASKLDFVGKVEETTTTHKKIGKDDIVSVDMFTYDHTGRLLKQSQKINNRTTEEIVANTYDELGQLKEKKVGGNLQTIDFTYNIRGWLTKINEDTNNDNDLFNFEIKYNSPTSGNALFNGNIAQTSWQTLNDNTTKKTYTYAYDALNRLLSATGNVNSYFNVSNINYDKNGNILNLARQGHIVENPDISRPTDFGQMDNLKYTYSDNGIGNKLLKVEEINGGNINFGFKDVNTIGDDYSYDLNGNMTSDLNKGINSIIYNHLNLPVEVQIENKGTIDYIYDATGIKLRKIVTEEHAQGGETVTNTDYAGNYMYESGELQFFNHNEGYIKKDNTEFSYIYQYKDHLGNIRLSYTDANNDGIIEASSEIIEEKNYYPFGLIQRGYNNTISSLGNSVAQKVGYTGKEHQEDLGIDWIDITARNYEAALGRWMNLDPLAEGMRKFSPYNYAWDNPINVIDPDGMFGIFVNEKGEQIGDDGVDDGKVYVVKTDRKSVESGAPIDGITTEQKNATISFIKENSGNTKAFENNSIAYDNSVEIEGSTDTRQDMVDIVNQDDGTGGNDGPNTLEYGGDISNSGEVRESTTRGNGNLRIPDQSDTKSKFHSHYSGILLDKRFGKPYLKFSSAEGPSVGKSGDSGGDIHPDRPNRTNYMFQRASGKVYIYNTHSGVQAIIPQENFVKFSKK